MQPLGVQDQGPVSQEIPPRIWRDEIIKHSKIIKVGKFDFFSVNVTEKLGGYSKFPEEGNFIGQKCLERPMSILRPLQVEEKRWSCSV